MLIKYRDDRYSMGHMALFKIFEFSSDGSQLKEVAEGNLGKSLISLLSAVR